jgi:hypothetical protein
MSAEINLAKHELAKKVVIMFQFLFPLPKEANEVDAFIAIWRMAIEDLDDELVFKSVQKLLLTMTRFPYPAELRDEVKKLQAQSGAKKAAFFDLYSVKNG